MRNGDPTLSEEEFACFRQFILREAGIDLPPGKRPLVQSRLSKRLRVLGLDSYAAYWRLLRAPENHAERQRAVNLLSTNETYFFREPQHFQWLERQVLALRERQTGMIKVWSAACSTGEEPYTIAMVLAETLGISGNWRIFATDINTKVLASDRPNAGSTPWIGCAARRRCCGSDICCAAVMNTRAWSRWRRSWRARWSSPSSICCNAINSITLKLILSFCAMF
jgi:hypothetical protein